MRLVIFEKRVGSTVNRWLLINWIRVRLLVNRSPDVTRVSPSGTIEYSKSDHELPVPENAILSVLLATGHNKNDNQFGTLTATFTFLNNCFCISENGGSLCCCVRELPTRAQKGLRMAAIVLFTFVEMISRTRDNIVRTCFAGRDDPDEIAAEWCCNVISCK